MKALGDLKKYIENEPTYLKYEEYSIIMGYIVELEALENRSCDSCKHWNDSCINLTVNTTGFCMYYGICNGDFEEDMKNMFCCKNWESR